jgi:hypothetical protein
VPVIPAMSANRQTKPRMPLRIDSSRLDLAPS